MPEAVANGDDKGAACIRLCSKCHAHHKRKEPPPPSPAAADATIPALAPGEFPPPALYHSHAPPNAIAGGHDYGRLSALRELDVSVDVSTLEKLVLAKARCHLVAIKV